MLNARHETRSIDIEFKAEDAVGQQGRYNLSLATHSHKIRLKKGEWGDTKPPNLNSSAYRAGQDESNKVVGQHRSRVSGAGGGVTPGPARFIDGHGPRLSASRGFL